MVEKLRFWFLWCHHFVELFGIKEYKSDIILLHTIYSGFLAPIPNNIC